MTNVREVFDNVSRRFKSIFMNDSDNIIRIELKDLPPAESTIVINLDDLPPEPVVASDTAADFVLDLPDVPCAFCHTSIDPGQSFGECKMCKTPYHQECWNQNRGCAVLGCPGKGSRNSFIASTL